MELSISTYKPTGTLTYTSPGTRRFFTVKAKRLVRLAHRIHDGRLFLPDIVTLVQEAAHELLSLGGFLLLTDKGAALLTELSWIISTKFAPTDLNWDIREKQRHRASPPERCTLCRVQLVWPAQIIWRRGLEVVSISAPIGIQCLTHEAAKKGWGKLQDLITQVRAISSQPTPDIPSADTTPTDAPPALEPIEPPMDPPLQARSSVELLPQPDETAVLLVRDDLMPAAVYHTSLPRAFQLLLILQP